MSPIELHRLRGAVDQGEDVLKEASLRPRSAMRMTTACKDSIEHLLATIVTEEKSPDLYRFCFPDRVLVARYQQKLARLAAAEEKSADAKAGGLDGANPEAAAARENEEQIA
eukprot:3336016-Prymnesium_polylepis.1